MTEQWWYQFLVDVPAGKVGRAEVNKLVIKEQDTQLHNLREAIHGSHRVIYPGEFTELRVNGHLWMSDTPAELRDLDDFRLSIHPGSTVLLHGLGLGCALHMAFVRGAENVTVVEKDTDVIALVGAHWKDRYGSRLTIIEGDALTWKPPKSAHWNVVWHDIWPDICSDNIHQMMILHRRFGRRSDWQGSWCYRECKRLHRINTKENREYKYWSAAFRG